MLVGGEDDDSSGDENHDIDDGDTGEVNLNNMDEDEAAAGIYIDDEEQTEHASALAASCSIRE